MVKVVSDAVAVCCLNLLRRTSSAERGVRLCYTSKQGHDSLTSKLTMAEWVGSLRYTPVIVGELWDEYLNWLSSYGR